MNKPKVKEITDAIGNELPDALDVKPRSVRAAREFGVFPASWFNVVEHLCEENGIECPRDAFNFRDIRQLSSSEGRLNVIRAPLGGAE